ncbi:M48 family metallopeptidase [Gymnodinialimonas hymeniacidonis]|uniref:M48 family metallopeptidase n=1 Tax=Gymnodinialimonas hymeniacidonis TaxID=3126508 RepID=UPI0034C5B89C
MRPLMMLIAPLALGACVTTTPTPTVLPSEAQIPEAPVGVPVSVARAIQVTERMEPVAEAVCRAETPGRNCDFDIVVLRDPRYGVNAFQTIDPDNGRPVIILTVGLIYEVRSDDELAFVIGHEAAHHIAQHIDQQQGAAERGARIFGNTAIQRGASREEVIEAANLGALVGSRQFSQAAELEADALGTIITCRAGFDPVEGAEFFSQLPDPGENVLGTHPPNRERVRIVRQVAAQRC